MNCDLENSFLLVYLSGPLIITHGPRGTALADPLPPQWTWLKASEKHSYLSNHRIRNVLCN